VIEPGVTAWRVAQASRVAVLIDGDAYFSALHQALDLARRSVMMLAWDVNRRTRLRFDRAARGPAELGQLLDAIARREPGLEVKVLCWDAALVYAFERPWLAVPRWRLEAHERVRFHTDSHHPPGASHHQKVVVIDDCVAFVGGFDVTTHRWDTPLHAPRDPRRRLPCGLRYAPFHDIQCLVAGDVARELGALAARRWELATGETAPRLEPGHDHLPVRRRSRADLARQDLRSAQAPWPPAVEAWFEDVPVAILRTQPGHGEMEPAHEIAAFNERAIASARHHIYIETQYLTAHSVARALCARLREAAGPEVTIVLSERSDGWLEHQTMDCLRREVIAALYDADRHGRLGVFFPSLGPRAPKLTVHSKLLVIDDSLIRIGSSNLSNRSLALDTECDVAIEAGARDDVRRAARRLLHTLLGEHSDTKPETVAAMARDRGSVHAALLGLSNEKSQRRLVPIDAATTLDIVLGEAASAIADPMEPIDGRVVLECLVEPAHRKRLPRRALALAALVGLVVSVAVVWQITGFGDAGVAYLSQWLWHAPRSAPVLALIALGHGILTSVGLPVTVAIGLCALTLGTWLGFAVAAAGTFLSANLGYFMGRWLGRDLFARLSLKRVHAIEAALEKRGVISVVVLRVVPVAPFALINLLAGACGVRWRDYAIGTAIGMLPGMLGLSLLIDRIVAALQSPSVLSIVTLVVTVIVTVVVLGALVRWARRRRRDSLAPAP
jgi:phosphatidylserine/phosphatidylglycerophosphate/cardiolipin synthase-like enzyme/uncharacterized membrane protein YdjX (TVP38/TMEM64 family)